MGWERKSLRFRKKPLFSVNPLRSKLHNKEHPICASVVLIYRSCFSSASASEQLSVSSSVSDCLSRSPNSSVTKGRFDTVSYFSELGCLISPIVDRIAEEDEVNPIQRYQHWYAFPLYSLASLSWVFRKDYVKFFQKKIGAHQSNHPKLEYFNLFFYKALYYFLFIVLPLLVLDVSWWQFLIGFLFLHIAQGLTMGLVFQLAHVVEGTNFPVPNETGQMEEAWAEHQMRTTANFATHNKLVAFFLGGLNRQIEHHLFPKVCHIHYGEISVIVKKAAMEFNLPYVENKSFLSALRSHFLTLKKFGKEAVVN